MTANGATNQSTEEKRRRGEVCVCKHVQEMVGLFLSVHAIWERSLGSKNGSEGLPSLTVNRGAKKSKITGNHFQSKASRALLFCLKTACRRDVPVSTMRFIDAPKAKKISQRRDKCEWKSRRPSPNICHVNAPKKEKAYGGVSYRALLGKCTGHS